MKWCVVHVHRYEEWQWQTITRNAPGSMSIVVGGSKVGIEKTTGCYRFADTWFGRYRCVVHTHVVRCSSLPCWKVYTVNMSCIATPAGSQLPHYISTHMYRVKSKNLFFFLCKSILFFIFQAHGTHIHTYYDTCATNKPRKSLQSAKEFGCTCMCVVIYI